MPERLAVGTFLRFRKLRDAASIRRSRAAAVQPIRRAACESLENRTLLSSTYYVSPFGSDSGPGTLGGPFKTIQEAANVAGWGDTVEIEAGTYRESVKPAHSGVTFTNYAGQAVTVSGANVISGWSNAGGSLYRASMPWDLGEGNNQVFADGQMVNEARWPNSGPDVSNPAEATIGGYSGGILYDQSITQGNGFWAGATITITPGQGWVAYTGVVNNSGPGWLQVSLPALGQYEQPVAGNNYFLSGKFQALDAPGEWYRDSSGALYLWNQGSDNPASHTIEAKARQYAFDLTGLSNTTIEGISLFAATIHTNAWSANTVVSGISAEYLTQFNNLWGNGWSPPGPYGIELQGNNSVLENSTIAFSAGDGVYVDGANDRVTNNLIHDVDYSGTDAAGIMVYGAGAELDHNTIYNAGRDGINVQASPVQVLNNVVHDYLLQTYDGAGIYTVHQNGQGSPIAYNTIYNAHKNLSQGYGASGILLDNDSSYFSVHDNTVSNVDDAFKANNTSYGEQIYNNQFAATQDAMMTNGWTGFAYDWSGSQLYNNVFFNSNLMTGYNVSAWGNSYSSGSPTLNTWVTFPSPVPSADPTPPAAGSGGSATASGSQASSATAGTTTPQKKPKPGAATAASSVVTASTLAGSIQGTFSERAKTARSAAIYTLAASRVTLAGVGTFRVSGTRIGAVKSNTATGIIRLVNARGVLTLTLTASNLSITDPTPTQFAYVISRATGLYRRFAGQKGSAGLTFTPGKARLKGTFSLSLG